jgi:outer membrane receptor protein involved in Fe transport
MDWASEQDRLSPRDEVDPRINPEGTDAWFTLGVHLQVEATDGLVITLGAENLLDRTYREHGSGFDAPGRNFSLRVECTL